MFFEISKKQWSSINFAVDFEILENAFKALREIRYNSNSYVPLDGYAKL